MSVRPWLEFKVRADALMDDGKSPYFHEGGLSIAVAVWQTLEPLGYVVDSPSARRPESCEVYLQKGKLSFWLKIFLLEEPYTYWVSVADLNYLRVGRTKREFQTLLMDLDACFKGDDRFQVVGWFTVWEDKLRTPYPVAKEDREALGINSDA